MLVDQIPLSIWLLLAVVFIVASFIQKPKQPTEILPKVRSEDEPRHVACQLPLVGHVYNYISRGPVYLTQLW